MEHDLEKINEIQENNFKLYSGNLEKIITNSMKDYAELVRLQTIKNIINELNNLK